MMSSNDRMSLPVSDPQQKGEQRLFKGSTMTSRGAYAALSYMSCAGILYIHILSIIFVFLCLTS